MQVGFFFFFLFVCFCYPAVINSSMLLDLLLSQCSKKQTFWLAESRQNSSHIRKANKSSHIQIFFFLLFKFFLIFFFFFFLTLCVCICVFFWWSRVGVPLQGFLIWRLYSKRPESAILANHTSSHYNAVHKKARTTEG